MGRPVHFEITADDPERAVGFYTKVFGWKIERWGPQEYWVATTGEPGTRGIDGAIMPRAEHGIGTINTIGVGDLETAMAAVKANGGSVLGEPSDVPTIGRFVYARDTEGNTFGILEPLPTASM